MIYVTLNNNMEEMLRNIKESKFISYECGKVFGNAYGNLRINTDKSSVEITNLQKTTPFFDTEEEVAGFKCKMVESDSTFKPYCEEPFEAFEVGESIKDIEIVNDSICINDGEFEISFDQAIIIRTESKLIMFSRDIWFSEDITISEHDDYNSIFPISQVVDSWSDDGENKVNVIRTSRKL